MNFSDSQATGGGGGGGGQGTLPQFSELRGVPNAMSLATSNAEFTSGGNVQSETAQSRSVHALAVALGQKQPGLEESMRDTELFHSLLQMQSSMKYAHNLATWPEKLLQLCENAQINVPTYSQNNPILDMQSNNLQAQFVLGNICAPQMKQELYILPTVKQELSVLPKEEKDKESDIQLQQRQAAQYFQKLQATSLPHTLQTLISKRQTEQVKKEKEEEEAKVEHNILNIPNIFRNISSQSNSGFLSPDQLFAISPDMNLHVETDQQENERNFQPVLKVEQQVQTDSPKLEKKPKFRAKMGEIKISVSRDGTVLYCCPECNMGLPDKADIEQHIQAHLQERKYECKECGAMLKRKEHLDQHMRGHSNDRPFKCTLCHKGFKRNEHLTRHYVIHSGDKNFLCPKCQKAFSRKDHLNKHMQTHSGIRKGGKTKEDSFYVDQKDKLFDSRSGIDVATLPKQDSSYASLKNELPKSDFLLQHIQSLQKNQQLLQTFTILKDQTVRDANQSQQEENININDILPQNVRYLMPS